MEWIGGRREREGNIKTRRARKKINTLTADELKHIILDTCGAWSRYATHSFKHLNLWWNQPLMKPRLIVLHNLLTKTKRTTNVHDAHWLYSWRYRRTNQWSVRTSIVHFLLLKKIKAHLPFYLCCELLIPNLITDCIIFPAQHENGKIN